MSEKALITDFALLRKDGKFCLHLSDSKRDLEGIVDVAFHLSKEGLVIEYYSAVKVECVDIIVGIADKDIKAELYNAKCMRIELGQGLMSYSVLAINKRIKTFLDDLANPL
jgi:hypothetical protein